MYESGRVAKNGEGLGTQVYHVNDIWWTTSELNCNFSGGCEVNVGGRGPHSNNALDFIIECSNDSQDPRCSQDLQYSTSPVRNSLYCLLHEFEMGNIPPTATSHPPDIIHVISVPRPSAFFTALPLPHIILNANQRTKMGEA